MEIWRIDECWGRWSEAGKCGELKVWTEVWDHGSGSIIGKYW